MEHRADHILKISVLRPVSTPENFPRRNILTQSELFSDRKKKKVENFQLFLLFFLEIFPFHEKFS